MLSLLLYSAMKITLQQAVELGIITQKEADDGGVYIPSRKEFFPYNNIWITEYFLQDVQARQSIVNSARARDITDQDIDDWREVGKQLDAMDFKEIRKRVVFEREDHG